MSLVVDADLARARLGRLSPATRTPLIAALGGDPIDSAAALRLLESQDPDEIGALLAVAGEVRTRLKGRTVTYSPKVFLPVTNLCRDRCSYCTFRADPDDAHAWTMLPEEIRACASRGKARGCVEALLCLGDKPEKAFRSYRSTLAVLGCGSTIEYVEHAARICLEEGLLPHTNAGVMTRDEMARLKRTNVSMGLMLENVSPRLRARGEAHHHAPDKDPALRMETIRNAGELHIPFTTGILLGIGETAAERIASLAAIGTMHRQHGHIQEVIVQNFRAKPATSMAGRPEPSSIDLAKTVAVARLMLREMNIQAPPNLSPYDHRLLLCAGINDWGGISPLTPDYVNPEAPWPHLLVLQETCRAEGFELRPRLPIYAEYINRPGFLDPALREAVLRHAGERGVDP